MGLEITLSAKDIHDIADDAAFHGDYKTADAWRLIEGNIRGGEVIRQWAYRNLSATEDEIDAQAFRLSLGYGASEAYLKREAMLVLQDVARSAWAAAALKNAERR